MRPARNTTGKKEHVEVEYSRREPRNKRVQWNREEKKEKIYDGIIARDKTGAYWR